MKKSLPTERTKTFRKMSFSEKVQQIWEYYRLAVFGILAGIVLIIYIIYKIMNPDPEEILNVVMVNASAEEDSSGYEIFSAYLAQNGYNQEEQTITLNTTLNLTGGASSQMDIASQQALITWASAGQIDVLAGNESAMDLFGAGDGLVEMDEILSTEQMEQYKDLLYTAENTETGEQYVCAMKLPEGNLLEQAGYYEGDVWLAIPVSSEHPEVAKDVFLYLLNEENSVE